MLLNNKLLEDLDVSKAKLGDEFGASFGDNILNMAIHTIKILGNQLGDASALKISKGLVYNRKISYLAIGGKINDRGFITSPAPF